MSDGRYIKRLQGVFYNMSKKVKLGSRWVGDGEPVYIIAEGGLTNWGRLDLAKAQVDAAMAAGADCVKFQAQTTEALVSKKVDPYWYRRLKYKELSHDDLRELWEYCQIRNIDCLITAHTDIDLEFLDKGLKVPFFKIGSGESINDDFLKNVAARKKPVAVSLGLHQNDEEIFRSIDILCNTGLEDIVILHCNTVYPTPPAINGLRQITHLQKLLPDYPIGYSDHTVGWHIPIAAVALGACVIEKHLSFDKTDKRSLDCAGSCTPEDLKLMVNQIREVEQALGNNPEARRAAIANARLWAQQSIVAVGRIAAGTVLTRDMLAFKRPAKGGIPADQVNTIIGKKVIVPIDYDEQVLPEHLEL